MKSRYALPVFFLSVAIFWLSLFLSTGIKFTSVTSGYNGFHFSYRELEGIDTLKLIRSRENPRHYSSTMYIRYADQPHITVIVRNLENPETAIKHIFIRQGNQLILQPTIHQTLSKTETSNEYNINDNIWRINEMILPIQISQIHTRGIELDITGEKSKKLPKLYVDTEDASIDIDEIDIASLSIRNRYIKESCTDTSNRSYRSGRIEMKKYANADTLAIESIYGHIELKNTAPIQSLHLKTTPETSVELDRLDIYPRMRWEPLPTPPLPECQEGAERMAAPPAMKAQ